MDDLKHDIHQQHILLDLRVPAVLEQGKTIQNMSQSKSGWHLIVQAMKKLI